MCHIILAEAFPRSSFRKRIQESNVAPPSFYIKIRPVHLSGDGQYVEAQAGGHERLGASRSVCVGESSLHKLPLPGTKKATGLANCRKTNRMIGKSRRKQLYILFSFWK